MPTSGDSQSNNGWKRGDFYRLATAYGANLENSYYAPGSSSEFFNNNAGPGTAPNFLLAGGFSSGSFIGGGAFGHYWSSTSLWDVNSARLLYFSYNITSSADSDYRKTGYSIRCLFGD